MLPLWREQLSVFLHPRYVVCLRLSRGPVRRVTRKLLLRCPTASANLPWEAPMAMLDKLLQQAEWQKAGLQVVLSNHFVNYALITGAERLAGQQEKQAYLCHRFVESYGEAARAWDCRLSKAKPGTAALASGIDQRLVQSLQTAIAEYKMTATGVYPHLMMVMNPIRRQITSDNAWVTLVEPGRICLAYIENGHFRLVRNYPCEQADARQLAMLLERESLLLGLTTGAVPVWLYWPDFTGQKTLSGWTVNRIFQQIPKGISETDNGLYRLALWA